MIYMKPVKLLGVTDNFGFDFLSISYQLSAIPNGQPFISPNLISHRLHYLSGLKFLLNHCE